MDIYHTLKEIASVQKTLEHRLMIIRQEIGKVEQLEKIYTNKINKVFDELISSRGDVI